MTDYVGAENVMVELWIEQRLAALSATLEGIDTGLSARIYPDVAPRNVRYPVIVYQCQDAPADVRGVGVFSVMVDTLYLVKTIAVVDNNVPLAETAKAIHSAMTAEVGGSVGDGEVFTSVRDRAFNMIELTEGVQYRHLGGMYRIHAQG